MRSSLAWVMIVVCGVGFAPPAKAAGVLHYIDNSATGCGGSGCSDSNNGTSKATAWVHAPKMPGCTGNCAAYTANPGDQFIFRGGDVWNTWTSQWALNLSGNADASSGRLTFGGEDTTWMNTTNCNASGLVVTYATALPNGANVIIASNTTNGFTPQMVGTVVTINGSSYTVTSVFSAMYLTVTPSPGNHGSVTATAAPSGAVSFTPAAGTYCRPVFDFGGNIITPGTDSFYVHDAVLASGKYVTIDNMDFRNFAGIDASNGTYNFGGPNMITVYACADYITLSNSYMHDATISSTMAAGDNAGAGTIGEGDYGGCSPSLSDSHVDAIGDTITDLNAACNSNSPPSGTLCMIQSGLGVTRTLQNDYCAWMFDCYDETGHSEVMSGLWAEYLHDSGACTLTCYNHGNYIHAMCAGQVIYNSIVHDLYSYSGSTSGSGVSGILYEPRVANGSDCAAGTYTDYNLTEWNLGNQPPITDEAGAATNTVSYLHYNDTFQGSGGGGGQCIRFTSGSFAILAETVINVQCVTNSGSGNPQYVNSAATAESSGMVCASGCSGGANATTETISTDYVQTLASFTSAGYSWTNGGQAPNGSAPTVGAGTNKTSLCTGSVAGLCDGLLFPGTSVVGPARPSVGSWGIGSYQLTLGPVLVPLNMILSGH